MEHRHPRDPPQRDPSADPDRTLVVIPHRTSLLELVDRVLVPERGRIAFDGPVRAVRKRPAAAAG